MLSIISLCDLFCQDPNYRQLVEDCVVFGVLGARCAVGAPLSFVFRFFMAEKDVKVLVERKPAVSRRVVSSEQETVHGRIVHRQAKQINRSTNKRCQNHDKTTVESSFPPYTAAVYDDDDDDDDGG
jgi:hypothetical protein